MAADGEVGAANDESEGDAEVRGDRRLLREPQTADGREEISSPKLRIDG
jgi:hypothetical protein